MESDNQHTNDAGENTLASIEETLEQRGSRYGEFPNHALVSQSLKQMLQQGAILSGKQSSDIPLFVWEAMDMICHKLGRVVNGDPLYDDNFRDIAGYAQLVVDELNKVKPSES